MSSMGSLELLLWGSCSTVALLAVFCIITDPKELFQLLEVDQQLIPIESPTHVIITADDILHS